MLLLGSRTKVTFISPSGCRWLRQNSFSPIILSRVILRAAYRRKRMAQTATSLGSSLVKVTFSLKTGLGPLWMLVLPLCFLLGSRTTWTCQELMPLRSLSGRPCALTMVTVSFWLAALYSKITSRSPHFEMGSGTPDGSWKSAPSCSCCRQRKRLGMEMIIPTAFRWDDAPLLLQNPALFNCEFRSLYIRKVYLLVYLSIRLWFFFF